MASLFDVCEVLTIPGCGDLKDILVLLLPITGSVLWPGVWKSSWMPSRSSRSRAFTLGALRCSVNSITLAAVSSFSFDVFLIACIPSSVSFTLLTMPTILLV